MIICALRRSILESNSSFKKKGVMRGQKSAKVRGREARREIPWDISTLNLRSKKLEHDCSVRPCYMRWEKRPFKAFMTNQEPALTLRTKAWFFNEVASSWFRANCSLSSETSCQTRMSSVSMVGRRALEESRRDPTWKCIQSNWNRYHHNLQASPRPHPCHQSIQEIMSQDP